MEECISVIFGAIAIIFIVLAFCSIDFGQEDKDWRSGKYDRDSEFGKWLESNWCGHKI